MPTEEQQPEQPRSHDRNRGAGRHRGQAAKRGAHAPEATQGLGDTKTARTPAHTTRVAMRASQGHSASGEKQSSQSPK